MAPGRRRTNSHHVDYVDVFGAGSLTGNPVAVVHDADDLDEDTMAAVARWTDLSETTFLLPATDPRADYRLRIFTPDRELPFAGHPTLGSAHAWLQARRGPGPVEGLVQECGIGLVRLRDDDGRLAFAAPPLIREGPVDADQLAPLLDALGLDPAAVEARWIDNGPGWVGLLLREPATVLRLAPRLLAGFRSVGVAATYPAGHPSSVEVRAFIGDADVVREDPVTGSLHAALARWLVFSGRLPAHYVGTQGSCLGRDGRVHVDRLGDELWVGGTTVTVISGDLELDGR
ncbi:PhzF family phenazine biosynthesis protein [Actinomycetospora succinea]|uniref:PhzF family phenazine biosynthesis protein n=1 Tax=Actinomycetospora succinea TaxID=663603 RepID=A0A4R6VLQ9_9PSEU|nr:PhzF family phenazine biosynthesis protein [Actinomycetospora succinea]TDQ64833.1 PhzF family phenazine biosynthesis protein [Actinomycetospora succinea]